MSTIKKVRCQKCLKKSLFFNKCKCENEYCFNCSPYFNHNCTFDWKKDKQKDLEDLNPKIIAAKVENI
jgi:hypothetical protein